MYTPRSIVVLLTALLLRIGIGLELDPVCCTPDQWEGRVYVDDAQIFYYIHLNGSAEVAYDFTNSRAFINATVVQRSLVLKPEIQQYSVLYIEDYKNNVEYELDDGKTCQKAWMDFDMTKQCVKGGAKLMQSGVVGKGTVIDTYNTTLGDQYKNIRATIERGSCLPVHLVYISSDYGSVTGYDVYDITPGIKDTKIFDIPPQCKHVSPTHRKNQDNMHDLKSRIRKIVLQFMSGRRNP
ncbi:ependymin-related protein 1-like [Mytilus trossulus]|uniref:ependymin-related protein 1-like n=1 Tax=Mytilus trossulus TaxID=6551 RepID=UPI00300652F3